MKKLKAILSFVFVLGIICLGFSFVSNNLGKDKAYAISYTNNEIVDMINAGECVEKGGAIYLSAGSTYNMSGGEMSGHFAEKGGALYISDGVVFTMTGGTITGNYAKYGGAIYVANGGECYINGGTITGNYGMNAPAIYVETGGILQVSSSALVDGNIFLEKTTPINVYVDGTLSKTIEKVGESYTIDESEMPLDYEHCCGYFLDSELRTTIKNDTIDLTFAGEEITFAPRTATASSDGVNIYTRTADPSLFSFTTDGADGYIITKNSAVTYSGTEFNLVMPREYDGKTVTTIADRAFRDVFGGCSLVNIVFSSEINTISNYCFDTDELYSCNIGKMNIHNNITGIGEYAFCCCKGIGELVLPDSLKTIGNWAFRYCREITGVLTIPNSVTSIGDAAFNSCSGLTGSLTISDSVTSIGDYVFFSCYGLTGELIIPDSVTSIGYSAFDGCCGLTGNLTIPDSVTSIGNSAFSSCSGLTGGLIIPDSVTSIGNSAFSSCSGLTSVYIPSSVTTISASSYLVLPFNYCSSSLVIYTDVANASSKPSGWSTYWNCYSSSGGTLTVNYGYTLEQYKSAVGLEFAPNGDNSSGEEVETIENVNSYKIDNSYLEEIILDKKEYIVLPKRLEVA